MGKIRGVIVDAVSGERVEAKVQVLSASGRLLMPPGKYGKTRAWTALFLL